MSEYVGTLFQLGSTPILEQAMQFNEARHRLVLSNIANADTPGYRRQDLDQVRFSEMLGDAIRARDEEHPGSFFMREDVRVPISDPYSFVPGKWFRDARNDGPLRHDENNVSVEREMALLAQNAGAYQTYSQLLKKNYDQMRSAITERAEG